MAYVKPDSKKDYAMILGASSGFGESVALELAEAGFNIIGVTHPDALNHYHFHLEGQRQRDNQVIYDISVKPKPK